MISLVILFVQLGIKNEFLYKYRLAYCGSGLFQVAFSSVAIWSAIYSCIFLKKSISSKQWFGIIIVTFGLCISPLSSSTKGDSPLTGLLLTLFGAQFYAFSYILNEYITVLFELILFYYNRQFLVIKDPKRFVRILV